MSTYLSLSPIFWWLLTTIVLLVASITLLSYRRKQFKRLVEKEMNDLLELSGPETPDVITPESLKDLPPIVQKWLIKSGVIGKTKPGVVYLKQKGFMRTKAGGKWMPIRAEQIIITDKPGFVWKGTIDSGFSITIEGRDKYVNGKGNMWINLMGIFTLANSSGAEIDQGALMRYLAEIIWTPPAVIGSSIYWEQINDTTARATLVDGDQQVTGLFFFTEDGDIKGFEGKRYGEFGGLYSLETWFIRILGYKEFNSVRIGNQCEVTWKLKKGDFTWLHVEVIEAALKRNKIN